MNGKHTTGVYTIAFCVAIVAGHNAYASEVKKQEATVEASHAEEARPDSTVIPEDIANKSGIKSESAGNAVISETVSLTGRITLNQNTTAQVKARFPGIVRQVEKGQGEIVKAGDTLAIIESNESLQPYPVKSPIAGVVLARNTNIGDVANDMPLFTVADVSNIWAEFHVFPRDIDMIKSGQMVKVTSFEGHHTGEGPINVVLPIAEASSQTVVARVVLPNTEGLWHSGMTVRGDVSVSETKVPIAVKTPAVQRMEGKTVIFIQKGNDFIMRPIKTGVSDKNWTQIIAGLEAGEMYVSENSFMIKADIGKAGAEHED